MKKIIYTGFIVMFAVLFGSCEMNYYPSDQIEQSQSFKSVSDMSNWINGMYQKLRAVTYGNYTQATDIQTDLFNATSSFGNRLGSMHGWTQLTASDYDIQDTWAGYYSLIANANNIIDNYHLITPKDTEMETFNRCIGEAYFMRAYAYAHLVNRYAKAYNASTASSDLGVPLNLTYDIEAKLPRSSIADVYANIFKDLGETENAWKKADFSDVQKYKKAPCKFTPDAIAALKARLYLNMEKWTDAIAEAEKIINAGDYPLSTTQEAFEALWASDTGSEILMHLYIASDEAPNSNSSYLTVYDPKTGFYTPDYLPEQWVYDLYDDADIRKSVYFHDFPLRLATGNFDDVYSLNKFPLTTEFNASGNFWHAPVIFRTAELYLIVAEAGARGNNSELALQRLNELRESRGLAPLSGLSGEALFEEVKKERVREMIGEGTRLSDLKRWNMGFTRTAPQNMNTVTASFIDLSVPAGDSKFVWGIPSHDINLNPNLKEQQNPGW